MPDARLTRTRVAMLPPGYQFGDAGPFDPMVPHDFSNPRCRNGCHVIYDGDARCLCAQRSREQIEARHTGYQFGDAKFGAYGDFPYRATDPTHVRVVPATAPDRDSS